MFTINGEVVVYLPLVKRKKKKQALSLLTLQYYSAFVCACTYRISTVYVHVYL